MASAEKTILVVDDSANDVDLLKRAFKGVGIRNPTQVVYSAEDAICYLVGEGRFKDRKIYAFPVLVLLDLKMPGTDGFEVLRWVRGRESMKAPDHHCSDELRSDRGHPAGVPTRGKFIPDKTAARR